MRNLTLRLFYLLILVVSPAAYGLSDQSIDKLIDISGLEIQISQLPEAIKSAGRDAASQNLPDGGQDITYDDLLDDLLTAEGIFKRLRASMKTDLSEAEAAELFVWLESPLGIRLTKAEEDASTAQAARDMQRRAASLLLSEKRVQYAEQIMALSSNQDMMIEIQDHTILTMFTEISKVRYPNERPDTKEIKTFLDDSRAQRRANLDDAIKVSMVYTYKKFDYSDIEKYIEFMGTPAAQKFTRIAEEAIQGEMMEGIERMAKTLADAYAKSLEDKAGI